MLEIFARKRVEDEIFISLHYHMKKLTFDAVM